MNFVIIIDRIYDLSGKNITLGGIQTYLVNLCEVINTRFNVKPYIYQKSDLDFTIIDEHYIVKGVSSHKKFKGLKHVVDRVKEDCNPRNTIVIWGSDQYSSRLKGFKCINIQHGIGFDTEAIDSKVKKLMLDLNFGWLYKFLQRYNARKFVSNGDAVVCVDYNFNNWIRTYLWKEGDKKKFKVIPNFTRSLAKIEQKKTLRKVLVARRFVKRRGIGLAVDAADTILSKRSDVEFTFAGDGPERKLVESLRSKYPDNVILTKYSQEQSLEFHCNYDIALVPSIGSEGTSLSLLEAMGAGCIPIATNVGGMTNIIIDNYNGFLIEPSVYAIKEAILKCFDSEVPTFEIRKAAWETAKNGFSIALWEEKWVAVINEVIDKK